MNFHDFIEDILCVFKNIQNNPSQTTTFIFATLHEAEPPQRFCIYWHKTHNLFSVVGEEI